MTNTTTSAREKLAKDMKAVIAETEVLLKATAGQAGDKIKSAHSRVEESLRAPKADIEAMEDVAIDGVKAAIKATNGFVHDNPWATVGIAAGIGLIVGCILARK